jgi:hypothetical protein
MKLIIVLLIFLFVLIIAVSGSHYRGSMITWRVMNSTTNPLVIEILQRHAWNYSWWPCTDTQITAGNYMIGSGIIMCNSSCPPSVTTIGSIAVPCTGYNQIEKYVSGEGRLTFKVPSNYRFRAVFTSSAWFGLVTGGGTWSVATEINTYIRSNGRYNQAPIVTMLPVIRLRRFLIYNIKINVADNDFDRYRCIWSNSSQECGGVCRSALSLPASTFLNETSCVLRFTPADQCIFVEPGQTISVVIRIKIQCPNATLANIIGVYPSSFT